MNAHLAALLSVPVTISTSGVQFVEITGDGVDKSFGLNRLCERWSINPTDVVAFGDNHNDAAMLSWAGLGVAMGNATSDAVAAADAVTGTNADDAVATWIERLLTMGS